MATAGAPYCIICGALIHSRTRKNPWLSEFRAVRAIPIDGQPFLTGVGVFRHRNALLSAPLNPHERYDDSEYQDSRSDEFVSQGRTSVEHPLPGFVFHDACWGILKALVFPHEIPISQLYDVCLSFPSRKYGLLSWGHGYGSSCSDMDTAVHGLPENYQQASYVRDPLDIPELQTALQEAEGGRRGESPVECSVVSEKVDSDLFHRLPVEIREEIQCLLSSRDVTRLRMASRSFASMPLSQNLWRSRFLPCFERGFIFEPLRNQQDPKSSATIHYDWKTLYEKTDPRLGHLEAVRNRRRVWECNKPLAELLILQSTMDNGGADAMDEHNHVVWRTVAAKSPLEPAAPTTSRQPPSGFSSYPPPSILKEYAIRAPTKISGIAVSLVYFNGNTYISGIRINTPGKREIRLGYIYPTREVLLDIGQQAEGSSPRDLTGFVLCADSGGIRGIRAAMAGDHLSNWAGDHDNVPSTLRLCLDERITHLKAKFDAFRMNSLSVPEVEQIHNQNPPCLSPRKAALWYPDIPSEDQCLHDLDFVEHYDTNPSPLNQQQPLIRLMFGGQQGNYLKYLTKISVSTLAGILTWIDFYYDCDGAPVSSLSVSPDKARHENQSKVQFSIDGPGGERVTGFRVKDKQWRTPRNEPISFSITTLEVATNRGRSFTFDANVLPKIRLPLGTHTQQKKKRLNIDPESTITGIYVTHELANGLTGLGVISEKLSGKV